jgi:hypothetical protein
VYRSPVLDIRGPPFDLTAAPNSNLDVIRHAELTPEVLRALKTDEQFVCCARHVERASTSRTPAAFNYSSAFSMSSTETAIW